MTPANDPTPRGHTPAPIKLLGLAVLAFLIIAIVLLALGVVSFEPANWF